VILRASAPATVANLGPGFDTLGLAVDLANALVLETGVEPGVHVVGEGRGELPEDASNLVFRAMAYLAREAGGSLPPFRLTCENGIPLQRGLGSSAAAVVAGLLLADRLLGAGLSPDRLLEVAVDIEGHPDNVAACLRGGLTIAYLSRSGWRAERLEPAPDLRPTLLIPLEERLPTEDARRALPPQVPRADASFNLSRVALAVVALTSSPTRHDLLAEALEDRLHQSARLPLMPSARALFADLREARISVCVAGAGPSLLAFPQGDRPLPELGPGWRLIQTAVRGAGASVVEE
jgi:homoserine kinase